jgi:hypothetical protein
MKWKTGTWGKFIAVLDESDGVVAVTGSVGCDNEQKEIDNAKLIAAAPEMLAFIKNIRDNYDCDQDAHKYQCGCGCRCCEAAKILSELGITE